MSLKICLAIAALFGSVGGAIGGSHLPECSGSPQVYIKYPNKSTVAVHPKWDNCYGTLIYGRTASASSYTGEFKKSARTGDGVMHYPAQKIINEGVFKNGQFQYPKKTTYFTTPSLIRNASVKLSQKHRIQIQSNLKNLGFYKSKIDGLFGKATVSALKAYNKKLFGKGFDLTKVASVEKLLNAILNKGSVKPIKPKKLNVPKVKPKPRVIKTPKPSTNKEAELFKKIKEDFSLNYYGGFIHTDRLPNTLFFFSEIRKNDSFEFRKALRVHDIELVVLSSPGGSVFEGLQTAGIIHDKKLKTYIPNKSLYGSGICASACSFMFFAGSNRSAEGDLGVHQFYSGRASDKAEIGATQKTAQFTVSEIIGFLNDFETPAWVYERMFQQSEMYYFKESELLQLETEVSEETKAQHDRAESFISDFRAAFKTIRD